MSTEAVWSAVVALADAWADSPAVAALSAAAPANKMSRSPVTDLLQELNAGGAPITSRPLALWTGVQFGLLAQDHLAERANNSLFREFLDMARQVELAHRATVAWIRAKIPGYPMLNAPQFARDSAWTTEQWTHRYQWLRSDFAAGLQFQTQLETIDPILGSPAGSVGRLTTKLASALSQTSVWKEFATKQAALTATDRAVLSAARGDLRLLLVPEVIDRYEPKLAMRRYEYREYHTKKAVDALSGFAGEYARSLTAVSDLIDLSVVDVFAQFVRFGRPVKITPGTVQFEGQGDDVRISVDIDDNSDAIFLNPGRIISFDHPLTSDLVRLDSVGVSVQDDNHARVRLGGSVIPASGFLA